MGSFLGFIVGSFVGSLEKIVGSQKHRYSLGCGGVFHIIYEYHCLTIYITRSSLIFQIVSCFSMIKLSFTFFQKGTYTDTRTNTASPLKRHNRP